MRWLIVAAALMSGCATVVVSKWTPADGRLVLVAANTMTPTYGQVQNANLYAKQRCPEGKFYLVEEGTQLSPAVQAYAVPVYGGGVVAGAQQITNFYWVMQCGDRKATTASPAAPPETPPAPPPPPKP